jgi:hypothetical protein
VVRHVANHLGLHVVECSCHDLMTSSESGAPAALATAFKEAQKYSSFFYVSPYSMSLKLITVFSYENIFIFVSFSYGNNYISRFTHSPGDVVYPFDIYFEFFFCEGILLV